VHMVNWSSVDWTAWSDEVLLDHVRCHSF